MPSLPFQGRMSELELSFSYDTGEEVFSSFSLSLKEGEHVLVLSPPGSGKTTLSRILTGSIPKYIQGSLKGHFTIDDRDILSEDIPRRMDAVGRVSQNTDEMMLFSSVEEEISFPLENMGLVRDERDRRIARALSLFGLERYRDVSTSELSGGEKRRLLLSVLFAIDPDVYILDESFDELSPRWRRNLAEAVRKSPRTIIALGSHELGEYRGTFDRIVTIEGGRCSDYAERPFPSVSFPRIHKGEGVLRAEGLIIDREHRSSGDLPSFSLSVPQLEIAEGECVTLLGENGSGKSSLSRVLSGLLRERSGSVTIDGRAISFKERKHAVAYLMQNPYEELFLPTVRDELESTKASDEDIEKALKLFSLDGSEYVQELSYGKAKMVQAAVFYLLGRRFVIFDELDSAVSYEDFIKAVSAYMEKGAGLLVITHDTRVSGMLPGRKLMIEGGVLHECE